MSWATRAIEDLSSGKTVVIYPRGGSMRGLIESGARVVVEPVDRVDVKEGDIVLCRVSGTDYLHLVKAVGASGILIGNNLGKINGYASRIYGRVVSVGS